MDILIITVGTRQIGWKCNDGLIRCFGVDGGQGYPPHINELYSEIHLERDKYPDGKKWGVRHLGEAYYYHCQNKLDGDFSLVQLLMDGKIIHSLSKEGLKSIILWATNQPEDVSYRAADTLWLAKLMCEKIKIEFPHIKVEVIDSCFNINDNQKLYEELQQIIFPLALEQSNSSTHNKNLKIAIQTKGGAPAIANAVDIFSGTLVRQFQLFKITPEEPENNYENQEAKFSQSQQKITVSEYFWQLEKNLIRTAWKRGDFAEAQAWLISHQNKLLPLYQLAEILNLARNKEVAKVFNNKYLGKWLKSEDVINFCGKKSAIWDKRRKIISSNQIHKLWENTFLLKIDLRLNYLTSAFFTFSQLIEQLLYTRSQEEKWIEEKYIEIPKDFQFSYEYEPNFKNLIDALEMKLPNNNFSKNKINILHAIRKKRNEVAHKNLSINTVEDYAKIIDQDNNPNQDRASLYNKCLEILCWTLNNPENINKSTLLETLHDWGLEQLILID